MIITKEKYLIDNLHCFAPEFFFILKMLNINQSPAKLYHLRQTDDRFKWMNLYSLDEIKSLTKLSNDEFLQFCAQHLLEKEPKEILFNRCPKCNHLARTPFAKQCPTCYHRWRSDENTE